MPKWFDYSLDVTKVTAIIVQTKSVTGYPITLFLIL